MIARKLPTYFKPLADELDRLPMNVSGDLCRRISQAVLAAYEPDDPDLPSRDHHTSRARLAAIAAPPKRCRRVAAAVGVTTATTKRPGHTAATPDDVLDALRPTPMSFRRHVCARLADGLANWPADRIGCQERLAALDAIDATLAAVPGKARRSRRILEGETEPAAMDATPPETQADDCRPRMNDDLATARKILPAETVAANPCLAAAVGRAVHATVDLCLAEPDRAEQVAATLAQHAARRHNNTNPALATTAPALRLVRPMEV